MFYEFRTYTLKAGSAPEVIRQFADYYETRRKYSELAAFWYTDIGPLNQIIHVWPYESVDERNDVREKLSKDPAWPPGYGEYIVHQRSEIFISFPFVPALEPGDHGPVYEMRYYEMPPGSMRNAMQAWEAALPKRLTRSPIVAAMHTEFGELNKFMHIWPYKSLDQRFEIRAKAAADGIWPPKGVGGGAIRQNNKIMYPAPFSPMQ